MLMVTHIWLRRKIIHARWVSCVTLTTLTHCTLSWLWSNKISTIWSWILFINTFYLMRRRTLLNTIDILLNLWRRNTIWWNNLLLCFQKLIFILGSTWFLLLTSNFFQTIDVRHQISLTCYLRVVLFRCLSSINISNVSLTHFHKYN